MQSISLFCTETCYKRRHFLPGPRLELLVPRGANPEQFGLKLMGNRAIMKVRPPETSALCISSFRCTRNNISDYIFHTAATHSRVLLMNGTQKKIGVNRIMLYVLVIIVTCFCVCVAFMFA